MIPLARTMDKLSETIDYAFELYKLGLRVTPLRGKSPFLPNWPNLHLSREEMEGFAKDRVNWGLILHDPACPVAVLDTDSEAAEGWVRDRKIDSTVIVRSGGEGTRYHRYFLVPENVSELRSKSNLFGVKGLELKALGSCIVIAGSIHPKTGRVYEYLRGRELTDPAKIPVFNMAWLKSSNPAVCPLPSRSPTRIVNGEIRDVRAYIRGIPSVQGQNGSGACYRVAALLLESGMSPGETLDELERWSEICAFPKWSREELTHKIKSVLENKAKK